MPERAVRIVVADDHAIVRNGLKRLLETDPRYSVVGEAKNGREAIRVTRALRPDLLLLDVSMPELTGLDMLKELPPDLRDTKVVVLTASVERSTMHKALQHGARGVVLKTADPEILFGAIEAVLQGRYWLDRESVSDLVALVRELSEPGTYPRHPFGLTNRQITIIEKVVRGMTNREIAASLSISEETVKHHLTQIFNKTAVSSRLELALLATQLGLVDTVPPTR
jgi:two-component system, NarL family, nitrate/nitrite response regulator NarL